MNQRFFSSVSIGWMIVLILGALGALNQLLLLHWYESRPLHGHDAPVLPVLSFCLDYLFVIWLSLPGLGFVALGFTASASWRTRYLRRRDSAKHGQLGWLIAGALVASVGSLSLLAFMLPSALAAAPRTKKVTNVLLGIPRAFARSRNSNRSSGRSRTEIFPVAGSGLAGSSMFKEAGSILINVAAINLSRSNDWERPCHRAPAANRSLVSAVTRVAMNTSAAME